MAQIEVYEYLDLIEDLLAREQFAPAVAHCRHLLTHYPRHLQTYRLLGRIFITQRALDEAADIFRRILSVEPDDFDAHVGLALAAREAYQFTQAIWHIERAFELNPHDKKIQDERAALYGQASRPVPADQGLPAASGARIHLRSGLYPQALEEARQLVSENGERIDWLLLSAEAHWHVKDYPTAFIQAEEVLETLPFCLRATAIKADVLHRQEKIDAAEVWYTKLQSLALLDRSHLGADGLVSRVLAEVENRFVPGLFTLETLDVSDAELALRAVAGWTPEPDEDGLSYGAGGESAEVDPGEGDFAWILENAGDDNLQFDQENERRQPENESEQLSAGVDWLDEVGSDEDVNLRTGGLTAWLANQQNDSETAGSDEDMAEQGAVPSWLQEVTGQVPDGDEADGLDWFEVETGGLDDSRKPGWLDQSEAALEDEITPGVDASDLFDDLNDEALGVKTEFDLPQLPAAALSGEQEERFELEEEEGELETDIPHDEIEEAAQEAEEEEAVGLNLTSWLRGATESDAPAASQGDEPFDLLADDLDPEFFEADGLDAIEGDLADPVAEVDPADQPPSLTALLKGLDAVEDDQLAQADDQIPAEQPDPGSALDELAWLAESPGEALFSDEEIEAAVIDEEADSLSLTDFLLDLSADEEDWEGEAAELPAVDATGEGADQSLFGEDLVDDEFFSDQPLGGDEDFLTTEESLSEAAPAAEEDEFDLFAKAEISEEVLADESFFHIEDPTPAETPFGGQENEGQVDTDLASTDQSESTSDELPAWLAEMDSVEVFDTTGELDDLVNELSELKEGRPIEEESQVELAEMSNLAWLTDDEDSEGADPEEVEDRSSKREGEPLVVAATVPDWLLGEEDLGILEPVAGDGPEADDLSWLTILDDDQPVVEEDQAADAASGSPSSADDPIDTADIDTDTGQAGSTAAEVEDGLPDWLLAAEQAAEIDVEETSPEDAAPVIADEDLSDTPSWLEALDYTDEGVDEDAEGVDVGAPGEVDPVFSAAAQPPEPGTHEEAKEDFSTDLDDFLKQLEGDADSALAVIKGGVDDGEDDRTAADLSDLPESQDQEPLAEAPEPFSSALEYETKEIESDLAPVQEAGMEHSYNPELEPDFSLEELEADLAYLEALALESLKEDVEEAEPLADEELGWLDEIDDQPAALFEEPPTVNWEASQPEEMGVEEEEEWVDGAADLAPAASAAAEEEISDEELNWFDELTIDETPSEERDSIFEDLQLPPAEEKEVPADAGQETAVTAMFAEDEFSVSAEEIARAAEEGEEIDGFDVPDDPDALLTWLGVDFEDEVEEIEEGEVESEEDGGEATDVAEEPSVPMLTADDIPDIELSGETAVEETPEAASPAAGPVSGAEDEFRVSAEEIAFAAEHGEELDGFDVPDDPEALLSWLNLDDDLESVGEEVAPLTGGFDEDDFELEEDDSLADEEEPVEPAAPQRTMRRDDEDFRVSAEEIAFAAEHGEDIAGLDVPDDPEALLAWLDLEAEDGDEGETAGVTADFTADLIEAEAEPDEENKDPLAWLDSLGEDGTEEILVEEPETEGEAADYEEDLMALPGLITDEAPADEELDIFEAETLPAADEALDALNELFGEGDEEDVDLAEEGTDLSWLDDLSAVAASDSSDEPILRNEIGDLPEDPDEALAIIERLAAEQNAGVAGEELAEVYDEEPFMLLDDLDEEEAPADEAEALQDGTAVSDGLAEPISGSFDILDEDVEDSLPDWLSDDEESDEELEWMNTLEEGNALDWLTAEEQASQIEPVAEMARDEAAVFPFEAASEPVAQNDDGEAPEVAEHFEDAPAAVEEDLTIFAEVRSALTAGRTDDALAGYQSYLAEGEALPALAAELQAALVERPHPLLQRLLGDTYMQLGDLQNALDAYRQAHDMM